MLLTIKIGGTSVGDAERIRAAAGLVRDTLARGHRVAVVTSAMAGVTNRLVEEVQRSVAVLGIVGEMVASLPGLMGRVDRCLADAGDPALTVLQGASPDSVVLALPDDEQRLSAVLRSLHRELGLDPKRQGGRP